MKRGNLHLRHSCEQGTPVRVLHAVGQSEMGGDKLMYLGVYTVQDEHNITGQDGFKARVRNGRASSRPTLKPVFHTKRLHSS